MCECEKNEPTTVKTTSAAALFSGDTFLGGEVVLPNFAPIRVIRYGYTGEVSISTRPGRNRFTADEIRGQLVPLLLDLSLRLDDEAAL